MSTAAYVVPADPADLDREAPADRFVCPVCLGAGAVLTDPRDPASVVECGTCDHGQVTA